MNRAIAALAASLALLSSSAPAAAQRHDGGPPVPALIDVPYVSQGELLCGGAAAAMLMRAAGARRVYAEDFAPLVDPDAGGIHTRDLVAALKERGYAVQVLAGTAPIAQQFLAAGRPVLALIQDRPGRFHFVVIIGWYSGTVTFHDPARAPFLARPEREFDRAWVPADRWMLILESPPSRTAEPVDTKAPASSPERDAATARFLDRDYTEAASLASRALASNPADLVAWRLLGASRYLSGEPAAALDAWNHAGAPTIDLVHVDGLSRTPHRAVERLIGVRPGTMLTRADLARADRRLALLPARDASRVHYVALPGNLAEVHGAIVERPLTPSKLEWIAAGARLGIDREVSVSLANLASSGDRFNARWRFREGLPAAGVSFGFPASSIGGVAGLLLDWQREHYDGVSRTETRRAIGWWSNWVTARLRLTGSAGIADFNRRSSAALGLGAEFRPLSDRVAMELLTTAGAGNIRFGTTAAILRWRQRAGAITIEGEHAIAHATRDAPPDQWPGAGTGIARPFLLRAHPLVSGGRIAGPAFGRTLAQTTAEVRRDIARRAFATLGVAGFVDVARAWERPGGSTSALHVDVGAGLRFGLGPGRSAIRVDVARGLRDGKTTLSAGWQVGWSSGSSVPAIAAGYR